MLSNKRGNSFVLPMATFIAVIVGILIISVVFIKLSNEILTPFGSQVGNMSRNAGLGVTKVADTFYEMWDWIIVISLVVQLVLLMASAFFIDTHPFFLILFIISNAFLIMFASGFETVLSEIFNSNDFSLLVITYMPMANFIRNNLMTIILGSMIMAGMAIFAKIRISQGGVPSR